MAPDMWSGWGIRTLSADHKSFNPYAYQLGAVWPHDNSIIAMGFKRYGFHAEAAQVARAISGAASYFQGNQLPELFAGTQKDGTNFPVQYLGANVPQAWAAGSAFLLLQAMLGMAPDAPSASLYIDPILPPWLPDVTLSRIRVGAHTFIQFMTGGIPDQVALGNYRWLVVALYWALLIGSFVVAAQNWLRDPQQRTGYHAGVFAMRLVAAGMWYLGSLWKLPLPVSGGFQSWMEQSVKYSSFQWHSDLMHVFLDHIGVVGPLVYLLELSFTVSLMLGFMVRISGIVAGLFTLNLLVSLYNDPAEWPWTYVGIILTHWMFAATSAGRSFGLDNLVAKRLVPLRGQGQPLNRAIRWAFSAA